MKLSDQQKKNKKVKKKNKKEVLNKYHWIITKTVKNSGHSHHYNPIQDELFGQKF